MRQRRYISVAAWIMRTDFKIGFVGSLVVVVVASWYFARNEGLTSAIPISANDEILPLSARIDDDATQFSHRRSEEPRGVFPAQIVATPTDETVDDSFATIDTTAEADVEAPSLDNVFTAALSSTTESELGEDPRTESTTSIAPTDASVSTIAVPSRPVTPVPQWGEQFETHTIKAGDTITELARLYYGDVRYVGVLLRANPLVIDPANIPIGTIITIPDVDDAAPPPTVDSRPFTESPLSSAHTHVVRKGDTLYTIARLQLKAAARWKEIYELNKAVIGDDPNQLPLGASLVLPR